jgi:hypothetical protein
VTQTASIFLQSTRAVVILEYSPVQQQRQFHHKRIVGLALGLVFAGVLVGCGGGGGAPTPVLVAQTDANLAASPTTTTAVANVPFTFPGGVTDFGTTAATTVAFTNTSTTPAFSISTATGTATGTTTFGSCVFTVTGVSGSVGSLHLGSTVTVHPCNLSVGTEGAAANGVATSRSVALLLGAASSAGAAVTVSVNPGGQLTLNGNAVGTVTLAPVTG